MNINKTNVVIKGFTVSGEESATTSFLELKADVDLTVEFIVKSVKQVSPEEADAAKEKAEKDASKNGTKPVLDEGTDPPPPVKPFAVSDVEGIDVKKLSTNLVSAIKARGEAFKLENKIFNNSLPGISSIDSVEASPAPATTTTTTTVLSKTATEAMMSGATVVAANKKDATVKAVQEAKATKSGKNATGLNATMLVDKRKANQKEPPPPRTPTLTHANGTTTTAPAGAPPVPPGTATLTHADGTTTTAPAAPPVPPGTATLTHANGTTTTAPATGPEASHITSVTSSEPATGPEASQVTTVTSSSPTATPGPVVFVPARCPAKCRAPQISPGNKENGGTPLVHGACQNWQSQLFGKTRYCGHGNDYTSGDCFNCGPLCGGAEVSKNCPTACQAPNVARGDKKNKGVDLVEGFCQKHASKKYGASRYDFAAGEVWGGDGFLGRSVR